ncbi:uncharacterized protein LOC121766826 [Salvia splendens]|uniref:uncharacterized protein LOC121766826 n=1 Tax=Salvia splendens TaxID=180675 RepID=UPI001C27C4B2|nr:uncharacterized protein LOC121766826 [Salvia splendens]
MVKERQRKMKEAETVVIMIEDIVRTQQQDLLTILNMVWTIITSSNIGNNELATITYNMSSKLPAQVRHMDRLFGLTDRDCISNLRMDRNAFGRLCRILRDRCGLVDQRYVRVEEQGCLGALDGTYINVRVSIADTPRYRSRNRRIATNTLAICDRFLRFVYILPGWEGSADSRVLRDAVTRPNGLKVRKGTYYLCDNGYANSEGFLTPFKGVRYHLKEWGPQNQRPTSPRELFNMRHTMARNIIERAFAVLKMRWGILRSASFYPIETQTRLIMTCFLLHNYIRGEMQADSVEQELDDAALEGDGGQRADGDDQNDVEYVDAVESTPGWNQMRQDLADYMWQNQ